jgi:uncharacterized protein
MRTTLRIMVLRRCALAMLALITLTGSAMAQERVPHRSFLDLLFRPFLRTAPQEFPPAPAPIAPRNKKASAPKIRPALTPTIKAAQPTEPAAKLETAKHILVVGDFMASALGDGLQVRFQDLPGVAIDERTNGSSGLVRNDFYDWITTLPQMLDELKPAILVVELGANDRQKMAVDGKNVDFRSPAWIAEYETRATKLNEIAIKRQIPVLWTGIPAFQSASLSADIVTINLMLRQQTEKAGGTFVDIWDGFVDENGKFTATGSDVDGQKARLRGADGISLTKAGKEKIAFYVEKYLRRLLSDTALSTAPTANLDLGLPALTMPTSPQNMVILRTEPMSMNDPRLDGATELGMPPSQTATLTANPRDRLVLHGDPGIGPAGRVDDFRLKQN